MKKIIKITSLLLIIMVAFSVFFACDSKGEEIDLSKYPFYEESYENMLYSFGESEKIQPYWKGNVIYNETVMLIDDGETISGKLLHNAIKVLSVRDFSWEREYVNNIDYKIEGNTITRLENSAISYLTTENLSGINILQPYRQVSSIANIETDYVVMAGTIYTEGTLVYGHQISVSYVYDVREENPDIFASYQNTDLPKLKAKLSSGENVNISIIGDSVSEGCSSSKMFERAPYMDNFIQLAVNGLNDEYSGTISLTNHSKGGMTSAWGTASTQIDSIVNASPDVLYIHFGINDCGAQTGKNIYRDNIESIILQVQNELPDCEFVIITAFTPNPLSYDQDMLEGYWEKMRILKGEIDNVEILDMYSISKEMLKTKKYMDVTGNGINHLNDYSARLYTMNILASLINY